MLGTRYGCETFISQRSKESSGDDPSGNVTTSNTDPSVNGIPFGGRNKLFPSKKAARHNAAAEAVAWLKENGYYSSATGKPVARPDEGKKADGGANGNEEDGGYVGMKKGMSYGQMVAGMSCFMIMIMIIIKINNNIIMTHRMQLHNIPHST